MVATATGCYQEEGMDWTEADALQGTGGWFGQFAASHPEGGARHRGPAHIPHLLQLPPAARVLIRREAAAKTQTGDQLC